MSIDIVVPDLGESVSEATIASWLVAPGDAVAADQPVVELETDKVNLEIGSPMAGVFLEALVAEGEDVKVGAVLGRVEEGEGGAAQLPPREATEAAVSSGSAATVADAATAAVSADSADSPLASPMALDPGGIGRSGEHGSVTVEDLLAYVGRGSAAALARSGPAVRKLVAEHGLDPTAISAVGRDGRITIDDVQQALATPATAIEPPTAIEPAPVESRREERVKLSRMRRTIATRLKEAQNTAAILTTFNEVDMTAVMALRAKHRDAFETRHGVRLGFTSFFAKACVAALRDYPAVNAEIDGDEVIYKHYYDIGMAVSTPNGLVVPVIRSCDSKSFADIEKSLGDLASRAKEGALSADDMQGGTFSITNGGVFGSLLSTPILNRPQSAILGLHKIEQRPMAVDGEVVVRPMMYVALSYDHRIIDGREAVTFLVKVKECIEEPESLMLGL